MGVRTVAAVLVVGLGVLAATPSPADAAASPDPMSEQVSAPLLADCSSISANGRGYARLHAIALCGADTIPDDQPLRTEVVGGEECGSATLSVSSRGGGLVAVEWRVASASGPITRVDLIVATAGTAAIGTRHFVETEPTLHAADRAVALVGAGRASVSLSGTVETFTATCQVAPSSVRIQAR